MLTGTLVTVAGFVPIGLNSSSAGEYTFTLFVVIASSLLISWIVAVLFTPLLGVTLLPRAAKIAAQRPSRLKTWFGRLLLQAMRFRWITIGATVVLFALSVAGLGLVQKQFFPAADRPELLVDMTLPQDSSIEETRQQMDRLEKTLAGDPDVVRWSSYVGRGAVRFYPPARRAARPSLLRPGRDRCQGHGGEEAAQPAPAGTSPASSSSASTCSPIRLDLGPPVGRPIQYRLGGPDIQTVRSLMQQFAGVVAANPNVGNIVYDWNEPGKVIRLTIDQDRARQLGVSSQDIATLLNTVVGGSAITQVKDDIYLVSVVSRASAAERVALETFQGLQVAGRDGNPIPLPSFATVEYELEQPLVWRRDRQPTITLQASVGGALQPADLAKELAPAVATFARRSCRPATRSPSAAPSRRAARARGRSPGSCR